MNIIEQKTPQYTKSYNTLDWTIVAVLKNNLAQTLYILDTQNINSIIIKNSLQSYGPTLELIYLDINFQISDFLYRNNLILQLYLLSPQLIESQPPPETTIQFFINNIMLIDTNQTQLKYKLIGQHVNNISLSQNINYATNKKDGPASPYKIIQQIFKKIQYSFDAEYDDTTEKINYITYKNQTIKDIITYCLSVGMNFKSPPMFFMQRLLDNIGMLVSPFSKNKILLNPYNLTLQLKTDSNVKVQSIYNIISDLQTSTFMGRSK